MLFEAMEARIFTLLSTFIAVLSSAITNFFRNRVRNRRLRGAALPPGPTPLPIVGCLFQLMKNKPTFRWIHRLMDKMNTDILCIRLGGVHVIAVTSPALAREFLKKEDRLFASRPFCMSAEVASIGYLATALTPLGDQWKKMKRAVVEVFSPAKHRWMHDRRREAADHLVYYICNRIKNATTTENGAVVDVRMVARHFCVNAMRLMMFSKRFFGGGMEDGGPGEEEEEHLSALFTILGHVYGFSVADYFPWLESCNFDGYKGIIEKAVARVEKYHNPLIEARIHQLLSKNGAVEKKEDDILDFFINFKDSNGNPLLSMEEIKAQIMDIMIATVDNPSNAVEWALAEMLKQPNLLEQATAELDSVVGRERLVQESDIPNLNFIKACLKESFRLHPVAPFNLPHVSIEDAVVGGYFIPKGSHVLLSRPGLGRNAAAWEEPLCFKPDRHLADGSQVGLVDPELNMISFSMGRRGCPAVMLGSTMTTILLARLVHSFAWIAPMVSLAESNNSILLAEPLLAVAKPRLHEKVYFGLGR